MDIPTPTELIEKIEAFIARHSMAETRFGRDAVSDPNLLSDLRAGKRLPGLTKLNRLAEFMARKDAVLNHAPADSGAAVTVSPDTQSDHIGQQASGVAA